MHYINYVRLFFLAIIIFNCFSVKSQHNLDSIQILDEVVVTANTIPKDIIPVQTLAGVELERLNAHSIADALRYFSGVQIKDYGGIGGLKTVNIRSMGSQHVGVFYDGIEIGNAQNGVVDLGRFSLENIETISLYNGQKSAIFQPAKDYASASSIYMQTKAPIFTNNKNYNINAVFKTGAFGLINPSLLVENKLSSNISSSLNTDYTRSTGKYKFRYKVINNIDDRTAFDTTEVRKNGDIEFFRIEHALFGKVKDGDWKTKLYYYHSERGYPGAIVREEPGRYSNEDRQWDRNFFFQSNIKKRITKRYSTLLSAKYAYDYMHYLSDPEKDEQVIVKVDNKYMLHEAYASSANIFNILPAWRINISADFQWNKLNANLAEFIYPIRYSGWVAAASSFHYKRFKTQASLLATYIKEEMQEEKQVRKNWQKYTPTLIASYQPYEDHDLHFRAFYKKIFRMPTFNEIYYTVIGSGTSNLRPEYATQYNLGITYNKTLSHKYFKGFDAQLDAYYNEISDKILAKPGGQLFRWTMMNIGLVKIKGMDAAISGSFVPIEELKLSTRLNYTYQQAQDYSDPDELINYKGQISYIPWHSGSAIVSGEFKDWDFNYSFIYAGERYSESANIPRNKVLAWYTHDISVGKYFKLYNKDFKVTMEVNNLFNQQYEVVKRYPMPGTNFKFIFRANI